MNHQIVTHPSLFVPWDIEMARINFGANCGPVSFAVATHQEVCPVMQHFRHFEHHRWTNLTQMRRAFRSVGLQTVLLRRRLPDYGVALIQWLGPWTLRDFYSPWSLIYTHWIAVNHGEVYDHTVGSWHPLSYWESEIAPSILKTKRLSTGWTVKYGLQAPHPQSACKGSLHSARIPSSSDFSFLS